ncbi:hypothetical protein FHS16_003576 [Paenibacillus endophyticus]|uniref:Uncharacterized protein n=1 Tax=Paenibacillus endophyticus TaxID=1294268 RepID=A0A7W5CB49_9BACL|nr:hypothetical protein [Paenibacillus endophyticus]
MEMEWHLRWDSAEDIIYLKPELADIKKMTPYPCKGHLQSAELSCGLIKLLIIRLSM